MSNLKIILLGPPSSGKGTQAEKLAEFFKLPHISTGNIFRHHIQEKTELGQQIEKRLAQGKLAPNKLTNQIVARELQKIKNGYILDGYPRNLNQVKFLDNLDKINVAILVVVSDEVVIDRISGRRVCPECGQSFHLKFNPPKELNKCDECGSKLIHRPDDKPEAIQKRLSIYRHDAQAMIDFYQQRDKLIKVNGKQTIDQVFEEIINQIEK